MRYTKKDYKVFVTEAKCLLKRLGLTDYSVDFAFESLGETDYAQCRWNVSGRCAVIALNSKSLSFDYHDPKQSARHEVLELLLCEIDAKDSVRHAIIRRLEKIL